MKEGGQQVMGPASHSFEVDPPPTLRVSFVGQGIGPEDPGGIPHFRGFPRAHGDYPGLFIYVSSGGTSD